MKRNWGKTAAAVLLVGISLAGFVAVAAETGTQGDPLITLSYLTDTLTPSVLKQVDGKIAANNTTLTGKLNDQVTAFAKQMDQKLNQAGNSGTSGTYAVVSLASGQTITGGVGTEFMLRVGTAVCSASSAPGLIDMTDGSSLNNGKSMVTNHLYMATIDARGAKATSSAKLLVRGSYTIK